MNKNSFVQVNMNSHPVCTWLVNSTNRDSDGSEGNVTNNVKISRDQGNVHVSAIKEVHVAGAEIPRVQQAVEPGWSRMYFLSRPELFTSDPMDVTRRLFSVHAVGFQYVFTAPATVNYITGVDLSDPTTPVVTTQAPHGLQFVTTGDVQLIGTPGPRFFPRSSVDVLSSTTFALVSFPNAITWVADANGRFGALVTPAPAGPSEWAADVTAGLNAAYQDTHASALAPFQVSYDVFTGAFTFRVLDLEAPGLDLVHLKPPGNDVQYYLGFRPLSDLYLASTDGVFVGTNAWSGVSSINIAAGDYPDTPSLADAISRRVNRFAATTTRDLVVTSACGEASRVQLPAGALDGAELATALTAQFACATPGLCNITVSFSTFARVFTFEDTAGRAFSLDFVASDPGVSDTLGFYRAMYHGSAKYISDHVDPDFGPGTAQFITVQANAGSGALQFGGSARKVVTAATAFPDVSTPGLLTISDHSSLHGLREADGVTVCIGTQTFDALVAAVDDAHTFTVTTANSGLTLDFFKWNTSVTVTDLGNRQLLDVVFTTPMPVAQDQALVLRFTDAGSGDPVQVIADITDFISSTHMEVTVRDDKQVPMSVVTSPSPTLIAVFPAIGAALATGGVGLYPLLAPRVDSVRPQLLGFATAKDFLPADFVNRGTVVAPARPELGTVKYVLVELLDPPGQSFIEHAYDGSSKSHVLAKIVFEGVSQRLFPMRSVLSSGSNLTSATFRILNPDHSEYQLHGQEWSATVLLFPSSQK